MSTNERVIHYHYHYHYHYHHHTPEEIMQAFTYEEEGCTIRETALRCGVSESTVKDWNRQYLIRGKAMLKSRKRTYSRYPEATKSSAVRACLSGEDANSVAERFGILRMQSIYAWSHDDRYRGSVAMEDERKAPRTNRKVSARDEQEGMSPEEELEYLRMENAILKN
jgi:transposase-like protein